MRTPTWFEEISVLVPALETTVEISNVNVDGGLFVAMAELETVLGDSKRVQVGWLPGCNDWPEDGQVWQIQLLGYDHPSDTWLARALVRES